MAQRYTRAFQLGLLMATTQVSCAHAQAAERLQFDIPAQELKYALRTVTRRAGLELYATSSDLRGRTSPEVHGQMTVEEALDRLLAGTGLVARFKGKAVYIRGRPELAGGDEGDAILAKDEIVVTGSRIRGAPPSAPVTMVRQVTMREQGLNDLGDVIRAIPQNFNGGQNPGVTFGVPGSQNVTSGSGLNLRGLGADATLTLLNGHRLAYDSATQAIDISAIPVAAVERLEVIADGASALYGSDAVAGVANVILKRDFAGLDTRARIGSTTEGGGFQQEYSLVGGQRWRSGGFMAVADFTKSSAIRARDRGFTSVLPGDSVLYPEQKALNFVLSGHQAVGTADVSIDAFYNHRTSFTTSSYALPDYLADGATLDTDLKSYAVAPRLSVPLGGWNATLEGVRGEDNVRTNSIYYYDGESIGAYPVDYSNTLSAIEARAEGPLLALPGGAIRVATGGGYRIVELDGLRQSVISGVTTTLARFHGKRRTAYGFGELFVPLVGPDNARPGVRRLDLTLAGRAEHDAETGSVFTPKIGLTYEPVPGVSIQGSWGRSFKEPTLFQLATPATVTLSRASTFASGHSATATVLVRNGGNPDLKPERARTWTTTIRIHPDALRGGSITASYFNVRYRGRIQAPLGTSSGALANPLYTDLVTLSPTASQSDALVASVGGAITNVAGRPYNAANVIAIFDNRYHNLALLEASGVDLGVSMPVDLDKAGQISLNGSASYITSSQVNIPGAARIDRAGSIYNPPHWRGRFDLAWRKGAVTVTPVANFVGGVQDTTNKVPVHGITTFDLTIRFAPSDKDNHAGWEVAFTVLNIGNRMPARIVPADFYYPPYDSANYSIQGRYVGLAVGKRW